MDRFREVEFNYHRHRRCRQKLPESWMQVGSSAGVIRFVETRFDRAQTIAQVRSVLGDPKDATFDPMSLRSIFLAMAKDGRKTNQEAQS